MRARWRRARLPRSDTRSRLAASQAYALSSGEFRSRQLQALFETLRLTLRCEKCGDVNRYDVKSLVYGKNASEASSAKNREARQRRKAAAPQLLRVNSEPRSYKAIELRGQREQFPQLKIKPPRLFWGNVSHRPLAPVRVSSSRSFSASTYLRDARGREETFGLSRGVSLVGG